MPGDIADLAPDTNCSATSCFLPAAVTGTHGLLVLVDFTADNAAHNPDWLQDLCDEVIGAGAGTPARWPRSRSFGVPPPVAGGRIATA